MTNPKDPQAELREAILGEVHLCGCQAMGADLEEVERLEHKTTEELFKLFQAHQQELLSELLGELPEKQDFDMAARAGSEMWGAQINAHNDCLDQVVEILSRKIGELNG